MIKSIFSICLALLVSTIVWGQKITKIKQAFEDGKLAEAKTELETFLLNEKNATKSESWLFKAELYNAIANDSLKRVTVESDPRQTAFEAYQKYLELDPKGLLGIMNQHEVLFNIAFSYQNMAGTAFNSKNFEAALTNFQQLEKVESYIAGKDFSYGNFQFPVFDTSLYLNIAAAAVNAKKENIAADYYGKLIDKKITGEGYVEIYRFVVDYFDKKGDITNRDKYLAVGKEVYPTDEFWCEVGLSLEPNDIQKVFAGYEKNLQSGCDNYYTLYNYAVALYNYANTGDKAPADRVAKRERLEEVLKSAINKKPEGTEAQMLIARHYLAYVSDLGDEFDKIKGKTPADAKKKTEINEKISEYYEMTYPYLTKLEATYTAKAELKSSEKGQLKLVYSLLLDYWSNKNDKAKVSLYQELVKK